LNGKAYYKITNLLKKIDISFIDLVPKCKIDSDVKLVMTTKKESAFINHNTILFIEDLKDDPTFLKEEIFRILYGGNDDTLVIGIDPGSRIGIVAYYQQRQVDGVVINSVDGAIERVIQLIRNIPKAKRKIKIGNGTPKLAKKIAEGIVKYFGSINIELVDERGTSTFSRNTPNRRVIRDLRSAMIIAQRQGKKYKI